MNDYVQRVGDRSFLFSSGKMGENDIIFEIAKQGETSNIDKNNEFFFNLVSKIAREILDNKQDKMVTQAFRVGDRDWTIKVDKKPSHFISHFSGMGWAINKMLITL
jgi:hypothetical protein